MKVWKYEIECEMFDKYISIINLLINEAVVLLVAFWDLSSVFICGKYALWDCLSTV